MSETVCACGHCNSEFPFAELTYMDDQSLCANCLDEETVVCQDCDERIWRDDNYGTDFHPLCERCYDRDYTHCTDCGRLLSNEDACYAGNDEDEDYPYCENCCPNNRESGIRPYSYKPSPVFHGDGPRYMGVELEVDNAEKILDIGNADVNLVYCKHDGSLEDGFEIVTHPCSLDYHMSRVPPSYVVKAVELSNRFA